MSIKTIKADVFDVTIEVATSLEEYKEIISKNKIKDEDEENDWDSSDAFCFSPSVEGKLFYIMAFCVVSPRVVIHESVHMAMSIMESLGVPIIAENGEVQAYLTTHLAMQLFSLLEVDK